MFHLAHLVSIVLPVAEANYSLRETHLRGLYTANGLSAIYLAAVMMALRPSGRAE